MSLVYLNEIIGLRNVLRDVLANVRGAQDAMNDDHMHIAMVLLEDAKETIMKELKGEEK